MMSISSNRNVFIFETSRDIVHFVFKLWRDICQEAVKKRGVFTVVLSAGKTLPALYKKLSGNLKAASFLEKTHIFLVDERLVSYNHHASNFGAIKDSFLKIMDIPQENIHSVPIRETLTACAQNYHDDIKEFFRVNDSVFPRFDLVILGIGEDGHTASLFPYDTALSEKQRLAVGVKAQGISYERVTLTLPVINNAGNVVFIVTGENKAKVVREVLEDKNTDLPASLVKPKKGRLFFLLDRQAGVLLGIGHSVKREPLLCVKK